MRLAGQEKMGFYATPTTLLDTIASHLVAVEGSVGARLLDPCCGMGEALAYIAARLNTSETWGAELSPERSKVAETVLTKVHHCAWQSCKVGRGSVSLVWNNPPYDFDPTTKLRLEQTFLDDTAHVLCEGGILVYIVPKSALGIPAIARHLAARYDDLGIYRFPDAEYAAYKQVVVFGVRKPRYALPTDVAVATITDWARLPASELPVLAMQSSARYRVPPAPLRDVDGRAPVFRRTHWQPEDLIAAAQANGVRAKSKAWREALADANAELSLCPAMPLKRGHGAMLLAAGLMGLMRLSHEGQPLLAKGRVIKTQQVAVEAMSDANGRVSEKTVAKDIFITRVATLDARGQLEVITDQAGLSAFMQRHGEELGKQVIEKHTPAYRFDPSEAEWQALAQIGLTMHLPGRKETGLMAAQKHVAIAAARALRKRKAAILNAEQGFGKTATACGVLELLKAYPAVVICPPHLVRKWVTEIERAVPGARARIVNCVERGEEDDGRQTTDGSLERMSSTVGRLGFQAASSLARYSVMDFVRDYKAGKLGAKAVAVVSRERAKLGSGWAPVAMVRQQWDREQGEWLRVLADPNTGQVLLNDDGIELTDDAAAWKWLASRQRFSQTEPVKGWAIDYEQGKLPRRTGQWGERVVRTPLYTQGQGTGCIGNILAGARMTECAEQRVGFRRYPLASFIQRKLKGFFKLLIGDELHQFAAARTDQAIAFHQLSQACRYTLGLTGTIFGGKASSLYHLMHRTSAEMRAEFGARDEHKWSQRYGVLEVTRWDSKGEATTEEDGAFSGYSRDRVVIRELPGISPAVIRYLLPHTLFARITDLGYALPAYQEQVVRLEMAPAQAEQLWAEVYDPRSDSGKLYALMRAALKDGDNALLSVWLQTALARPNSCFRAEDVQRLVKLPKPASKAKADLSIVGQRRQLLKKEVARAKVMALPAVSQGCWLPKEQWLMDYCQQQIAKGRKVLVYVRQTGTRDIQPRIAEVLKSAAIRVKVLPTNIKPENREAWVQVNASSLDVLIVNPQKVETGLDLVMFHSIVWFEINYSLYVMWQAMRRVWRLGQTKPVEVIFLSYKDTLEDLALSLMGRKLYAAQLLYGDEVGGAIVESDDGNFLTELARAAMSRVAVEDLSGLFAEANGGEVVTQDDDAMMGESVADEAVPVPASPLINPGVEVISMEEMRRLAGSLRSTSRRGRRAESANASQLSFLSEEMGGALVELALADG